MTLSIIVAVADKGVIGRQGQMAWHLPAELAYFRKVTTGHPIIMGRVTHESIGRTLPDRLNLVITRNPDYRPQKGSLVVNSLEAAIEKAETAEGSEEIFVIGGEEIFRQALPLADKIYLTQVQANIEGDKFFHFDLDDWQLVWSEEHQADGQNKYPFDFMVYNRKS
ncbi:hypothetical protein A3F65_01175 [Candidatus Saccharibacteria bacterium RIFCSPHIGHO2_12_FULL_47_16b]|nr:MAG: hypothetical protein A3F65_01175 [Candidatus Saccharibacteria bacterium RIFCSPHIGHO2_12_FULL_47_16b]